LFTNDLNAAGGKIGFLSLLARFLDPIASFALTSYVQTIQVSLFYGEEEAFSCYEMELLTVRGEGAVAMLVLSSAFMMNDFLL
jgi:hypothetical protein